MDKLEFLKSVLGDEGYYCVAGFNGKGKKTHKYYATIEELCHTADDFCNDGYDAYFALGTFIEAGNRRQGNVEQLRSIFIDIDYGPHHGGETQYDTLEEAVSALRSFCKEFSMPQPYIVSTGGGVHAYWPLAKPIDKEEWHPIAVALKDRCVGYGLGIDTPCTIDSARILRVPGTYNFKTGEKREVKILRAETTPHPAEFYKDLLGVIPSLKLSHIRRTEEDDAFLNAMYANRTSSFRKILEKTLAGKGCAQLKRMVETRVFLDEPSWRAGLSIAKFCVDATKAMEMISIGHPDFSPAVTEKKANAIPGPFGCEKIREYSPVNLRHLCTDCQHWGKITNPLALSYEVIESTAEFIEGKPEEGENGVAPKYPIPPLPRPYFRAEAGGIYKRVKKEDELVDIEVYHNDFFVVDRMHDAEQGDVIIVSLHLPKDAARKFMIPMSVTTTTDEFKKLLASKGMIINKPDELRYYINETVKRMQYEQVAQPAARQFGWTDSSCKKFVLGDKCISFDKVEYNAPSSATSHMFPVFTQKGSMDLWREAMEFYDRPGMEVHQFVIGLAFGSIFTEFSPVNAALLHLYSPESGLGKTTALQAAASIWGDPSKMMLKETDTTNSKMLRAEVHKNVIMLIDELSNLSGKDMSDFVYPMTSGYQKNRMTSSANSERVRGDTWKLMMVSTGNVSATDKLATYKASPQGELKRLLDVQIARVEGLAKEDTDKLSLNLVNNYGHAAVPYLQYVMKDINGIRDDYQKTQLQMDERFEFTHIERFYSVMVTNAIVGIRYAKKAGLLNFRVSPILDWFQGVVSHSMNTAADFVTPPEETISAFWAEYWNSTLRIESTADLRVKSKGDIDDAVSVADAIPKGSLVLRYEYDVKLLFMYPEKLRLWCNARGVAYSPLIQALKCGKSKARIVQKAMGTGTRANLPNAKILVLDGSGWINEEAIAQKAAQETTPEEHESSVS